MRNLYFIVLALWAVSACSEDDHRIDISYTGEQLSSIQTPLGGIGTGSMVLNGCGGIREFDLLEHPLSENENDLLSFFALHITGEDHKPVVRLLERDCTNGVPGSSAGDMLRKSGIQGFREAVFHNAYPVVNIDLLDDAVPLKVAMNAWSPLIPVDPQNSRLPAAVIEWDLVNPGRKKMAYSILFMMENPLKPALQGGAAHFERLAITSHSDSGLEGITFSNYQGEYLGSESGTIRIMSPSRSNLSVVLYSNKTVAYEHFSREFLTNGELGPRRDDDLLTGNEPGVAAIHISGILHSGESVNIPFLFSWHMPRQIGEGYPEKCIELDKAKTTAVAKVAEGATHNDPRFQYLVDIDHLSGYLLKEFEKIRKKTLQFSDAIITSTVTPGVVDTMITDLAVAIGKRDEIMHFMRNPMDVDDGDRNRSDVIPGGSDAIKGMRGWDRYLEMTGYSYEEEGRVMKISPAIDVLPVRYFWSTNTGWGTINISRAAIILACNHGFLDLKELIMEGRSFFVFREFVPSQDAAITYNNETLSIAFPAGILLDEGAVFHMEIP